LKLSRPDVVDSREDLDEARVVLGGGPAPGGEVGDGVEGVRVVAARLRDDRDIGVAARWVLVQQVRLGGKRLGQPFHVGSDVAVATF
jgi:hypothetical protein